MEKTAYRPDVDGLRAVAVLSVIFYHAGFDRLFGGGYVGVDIFFVISGYIIARMIASQLASGTWSFADFYERRFRRILPPLFCMIVVMLAIGWFLFYDPGQLRQIFRMLKRVVLGLSNFHLYATTGGYFDAPEQNLPLLHTWSLAVEEQFYLFLPILLWLLWTRARGKVLLVLAGLTLLSLLFSGVMVRVNPRFDFYMLPTRSYELLLGVVLALGETRWPCRLPALTHLIGLVLIGLSVLLFGLVPRDAFPGLWALLPCLGTALCIWAGSACQDTASRPLTVRWLGSRPMRGIGLISYGLYLYHWPFLVLQRQARLDDAPPQGAVLLGLAGVFVFAALSYFFLEQPIRQKRVLPSRRRLFAASLAGILAFFLLGQYGRQIFEPYVPPEAAGYPITEYFWDFTKTHTTQEDGLELFTFGDASQPPSLLVLGDSHAMMLVKTLDALAAGRGVRGEMYALHFSFPRPLPAVEEAARKLVEKRRYAACLLAFRWALAVEYKDLAEFTDPNPPEGPLKNQAEMRNKRIEIFAQCLRASIQYLLGKGIEDIVIVMPFPSQKVESPPARAVHLVKNGRRPEDFLFASLAENRRFNQEADALLREIAAEFPQVRLLDPMPFFCSEEDGRCVALDQGKTLYMDDDHLSIWGAERVKPLLAEIFSEKHDAGTGEDPQASPEKSPRQDARPESGRTR